MQRLTVKNLLTSDDVKDEDWSAHDPYPKTLCVCVKDHNFYSHGKFSGRHVQIISRDPCPQCGTHTMRKLTGEREVMSLSQKDQGSI